MGTPCFAHVLIFEWFGNGMKSFLRYTRLLSYFSWYAATCALFVLSSLANAAQSQCYGTVSKGRITDSVKLPVSGSNFAAYSSLASAAGRTYVHSVVADIITSSYAALARTHPDKMFVYGETGWPSGGRFRPHRTHQNGLSVDFFVPVLDATGRSVALPTGMTQRFGYDIEFNSEGRYQGFSIDFAAMAEHLFDLDAAAKARGASISLVIFDPPYLPKLFATPRGPWLRAHLPFMQGKAWVRHDEHYHVDFALACKPLG
jgi:penicillin-insensitive murein DD-endopeptidase